jgi:HSP20 family protein
MFRKPFSFYSSNPWRDIEQMQRDMDHLFNRMARFEQPAIAAGFPAINVWANEDGLVVTAELPGMNPDDIDISVVNETLTLSGLRQPDELKEGDKYHRRERRQGKFNRTFQLPFAIETDKVSAVFENGVLHISLPRAEAEKPKKIAVKAA